MTEVVNIKKCPFFDIYIGRPSIWGNPFKIGKNSTSREESLVRYRIYAKENIIIQKRLMELEGRILGCWCKPLACHGDILIEMIKERKKNG